MGTSAILFSEIGAITACSSVTGLSSETESPRVFRRHFILRHATLTDSSNWR